MSRKAGIVLISVLLAVSMVACTGGLGGIPVMQQPAAVPATQEAQRGITVVGVGRVSLVPDIARISVGVEVRGNTVSEAKAEVDRTMKALASSLIELGIAERDIQTSQYSIYYEPDPNRLPVAEGATAEQQGAYRVSSMVEVTVRQIDKASAVLDGAIEAGANQVYGVTYTVSDDQQWQSQAREEAIADAGARAQEYAQLLGMELGRALSISEVIGGQVPFAFERAMAGGGGGIAPGELEMSVQVQVTYAAQ